jgi:oxygen-independent coproporphyrinogen-3 oxidase
MKGAAPFGNDPYDGYSYAYPHKTAYRSLDPPVALGELWADEDRSSLFLYFHIPFCRARCAFCNLLSLACPDTGLTDAYLKALEVQARVIGQELDNPGFARLAIGGGTPTYFSLAQLKRLFAIPEKILGVDFSRVPASVEVSPLTVDQAKLDFLAAMGVDRVSVGIQSFIDKEAKTLGRVQTEAMVHSALQGLRDHAFQALNIDLIYGIPGQTEKTWLKSLRRAIDYSPEEIYLYPLYIRPGTHLAKMQTTPAPKRLDLYRLGRDFLKSHGYRQLSMRMFAKGNSAENNAPVYCCQEDGMVGLGCGARSYTRALHYSSRYAVSPGGVKEIIREFASRKPDDFRYARYGYALDPEDRRRRYVIKTLLRASGLSMDEYHGWFRSDAMEDLPQLAGLTEKGLAQRTNGRLHLTAKGLEQSDAIGPWLYSTRCKKRMEAFLLK